MTRESRSLAACLSIAAVLIGSVAVAKRGVESPLKAAEGKVMLLEFSDYQCPACAAAVPVVERLRGYYKDKLVWEHRNYPLEAIHARARAASRAAVCAEKLGAFESFHKTLFEKQAEWVKAPEAPPMFASYAKAAGLDAAAFDACVADPATDQKVTDDYKEGLRYGVRSTPTFFVNGERLAGSQQLSQKGAVLIDRELAP